MSSRDPCLPHSYVTAAPEEPEASTAMKHIQNVKQQRRQILWNMSCIKYLRAFHSLPFPAWTSILSVLHQVWFFFFLCGSIYPQCFYSYLTALVFSIITSTVPAVEVERTSAWTWLFVLHWPETAPLPSHTSRCQHVFLKHKPVTLNGWLSVALQRVHLWSSLPSAHKHSRCFCSGPFSNTHRQTHTCKYTHTKSPWYTQGHRSDHAELRSSFLAYLFFHLLFSSADVTSARQMCSKCAHRSAAGCRMFCIPPVEHVRSSCGPSICMH